MYKFSFLLPGKLPVEAFYKPSSIASSQSEPFIDPTQTTVSKTHRRKGTPRCKIRQPVVIDTPPSGMSSPGESSQYVEEASFVHEQRMEPKEPSTALDLSDRTNSYAYTLEGKEGYTNGLVAGTMPGFVYEEAAMKSEFDNSDYSSVDTKNFKNEWMEEKIDMSTNSIVQNVFDQNRLKIKKELQDETPSLLSAIDITNQLPAVLSLFGQSMGDADSILKTSTPRPVNRRKSRRAPVKVDKKSLLSTSFTSDAISPIAISTNNNEVPNDVPDLINKGVVQTSKRPGNSLVHISTSVRNQRGRKGLDISDMKSAFEEIGNMAKCLICNKILANKNNRTFHWRSHVGDKRYSCDICHKAFTHPSNMRSHRKIHTDEKPFPCDLCERRFRRRDYLLQHLERFHYNPKSSGHTDVQPESNSVSAQGSESNSN